VSWGPEITVGVMLAVAALALLVVVVHPWRSWDAAAEHARGFWGTWIVGSVAVGVLPLFVEVTWGTAVWCAACCAFGALQPSLVVDIVEVRQHIARTRRRGHRVREEARARLDAAPR
jgi:hypothetical protein